LETGRPPKRGSTALRELENLLDETVEGYEAKRQRS
jgi:hypothetical protein